MADRESQFPYEVSDLKDLPERFQQAAQPLLKPVEPITSILMLPPQPFLGRRGVPRQALLSTAQGILHIRDGQPPTATYLHGESLLYVHYTLVLLYNRLELAGEVNGRLVHIVIEYNTVGQHLVEIMLTQFLYLTYGMAQPVASIREQNDALLQKLETESFKFMNGLRHYALQRGERLLGYVYQPRIKQPLLHFFNRPIAPSSLLALTDKAVILIEEEKVGGPSYGWVITLCLRKVVETVESRSNREWRNICIHLARNSVALDRQVMMENDKALDVESLWSSPKQSDDK